MTEITLISIFIFALILGFMIGRRFPSNKQAAKFEKQVTLQQQKMNEYQQELEKCQTQIKQQATDQAKYQHQVSTHFSKTTDLIDNIASQYQSLHQYIAQQAVQLLPEQEAAQHTANLKRIKIPAITTASQAPANITKTTAASEQTVQQALDPVSDTMSSIANKVEQSDPIATPSPNTLVGQDSPSQNSDELIEQEPQQKAVK